MKKLIIPLLLLCGGLLVGINPMSIVSPSYQVTLLLPINVALPAGKRLNLSVEIPRGFRALPQPENASIQEFIPQTDKDMYHWSRIITTQLFVGREITALSRIKSLKHAIKSLSGTNAKVITESAHDCGIYTTATIIIAYANPQQAFRREIMYARYYSGPYDCTGFQYTVAITDEDTDTVVQQLKEFADRHTSLITF